MGISPYPSPLGSQFFVLFHFFVIGSLCRKGTDPILHHWVHCHRWPLIRHHPKARWRKDKAHPVESVRVWMISLLMVRKFRCYYYVLQMLCYISMNHSPYPMSCHVMSCHMCLLLLPPNRWQALQLTNFPSLPNNLACLTGIIITNNHDNVYGVWCLYLLLPYYFTQPATTFGKRRRMTWRHANYLIHCPKHQ